MGLVATEPCRDCDGTGVASVPGVDYKAELSEPKTFPPCLRCVQCYTVGMNEVCPKCGGHAERFQSDSPILADDPLWGIFTEKESAAGELNRWLGHANVVWSEIESRLISPSHLGLRLAPSFITRLVDELNTQTYLMRVHKVDNLTWAFNGAIFEILPHAREDWDPEIVIRLRKGDETCKSTCSTPKNPVNLTVEMRAARREAQEEMMAQAR